MRSDAGKVLFARVSPAGFLLRSSGPPLVLFVLWSVSLHAATFHRTQLVFGDVELSITTTTSLNHRKANALMNAAFKEAKRIDAIFSSFKPDSELSQLNAMTKPALGVRVSPLMYTVLESAMRFTRATGGAFDLTWEMPNPDIGKIRVNAEGTVDFLSRDARVNPTGLIKGLAVDRIIGMLKKNRRVSSATVATSGDIAHFDRSGGGEPVMLRDPDESDDVTPGTVTLGDGAVSTSGFYERGRHIRDTAASRDEHLQVSVTALNALTSDALSTAMMFMTPKKIRALVKRFPGTGAVVYDHSGKIARYGAARR